MMHSRKIKLWCTMTLALLASMLTVQAQDVMIRRNTTTTTRPAKPSSTVSSDASSQIFTVGGVSFKMIKVEPGTFQMGSTSGDSDEKPVHSVTLTRGYYIGETEVTQALWYAVMGQSPTADGKQWSSSYGLGDNYPAYNISYEDCQQFIAKLNQMTGQQFRLPTEAEWEFAAKGGNKSKGYTYAGSNTIGDVAWYTGNSGGKTHPVKTKASNELGLYDMSGNVWEWCYDWSGGYSSSAQTDPTGPATGSYRVIRGGGWRGDATRCRVANRIGYAPSGRDTDQGLRLALSDNQEEEQPQPESDDDVETFTVGSVSFKMIKVEPGTFQMGSNDGYNNEKPVHSVTLTRGYYMGETEVTQALWYAVMGQSPTSDGDQWEASHGLGDNCPAYYISYEDCQQFLTKLNQITGKNFRFPTEAEWEFAAKGGNKSKGYTYSGSNTIGDVAWYTVNSYDKGSGSPDYGTHEVKTKAANELGLYDMSGNVWEWCYDWYGDYSSSAQTDPTGPATGSSRVNRGGGWLNSAPGCRVAKRNNHTPSGRVSGLGLRLAL